MCPQQRSRFLQSAAFVPVLLFVFAAPVSGVAEDSDWPDWADKEDAQRERAARVNEGDLKFLPDVGDEPVHHHSNHITIDDKSLVDGWVLLEQCHTHLDRVPALQIVFNPERVRALEVTAAHNIGEALADGNTIQLRDIGASSRVCVRSESRALHLLGEGQFELRNGPFMRRFLDGYYPLRLSLRIAYPPSLRLADFSPGAQAGFSFRDDGDRIEVDALFEGRLHTRFRFLSR